jgi:hypothetical protein
MQELVWSYDLSSGTANHFLNELIRSNSIKEIKEIIMLGVF